MDTTQKSPHIRLGKKGEDIAAAYLTSIGYTLLEKNWRLQHKELDIIAVDGPELVAVEVKTRTDPAWEALDQSISIKKRRHLIHAAHAYVRINRISLDVRFDVVLILTKEDGSYSLQHIPDAFIPVL